MEINALGGATAQPGVKDAAADGGQLGAVRNGAGE